ncbi:methylated-DNA--[protein]-cysteine S-methyltransferase [Fulvivirga maritima]|uniref:methylated-DNA--[protein]-cysteine S-methyltransferase n=1 Tax=Fulvivirga maritima TaxID=2904247 RepID=UPI001F31202F|nr:methylated-DNA--[protein]-cysteine S-methyltransferase [Fulvivirga maritima]UII24701.1 methylated-DNA--[protein]-cysteine S-methyltransferase [Fulvivirga maritima]
METKDKLSFDRIAKAIEYLQAHFRLQPNLNEVARQVHLSPSHFQRLFTEWAGTSPKKFLQYISVEHAKAILQQQEGSTLFDATFETGLSSTSRLHDLFVNIEGMTPAEYKNGGKNLIINYSWAESPFGHVLVASTQKGICYMEFHQEEESAVEMLMAKYPKASFNKKMDDMQRNALIIFQKDWSQLSKVKLHLKGTDFQLKVWESLLKIPMGKLSTYGRIAEQIGNPKASRAVGTAVGNNPVAFLIPCHRVIQSSGVFGGYMWGTDRKTAIIGWEGVKVAQ